LEERTDVGHKILVGFALIGAKGYLVILNALYHGI